jgi:hypothetical protein
MLARSGALSEAEAVLLEATFLEAHMAQQRIITETHIAAAAKRVGGSVDELRSRVVQDRLPLLRLLVATPELQMQAFHLSFQEFYAMRAIATGGVRLLDFRWDVWWTNTVFMGVQTGDAFGGALAEAAGLAEVEGGGWRSRVVTALARTGLPTAWLPTVAEAAGALADLPRLKRFVGRYRDVLAREGGKAVAQLVLQQPEAGVVFDELKKAKTQRLLTWRNKPLADPCVATLAHEGSTVNALAVSKTRIVGGAGKTVHVYDMEEELLGKLDGASDVKSVAVFEGEEGEGWIAAGYENGTIKVWDSGALWASNRLSCSESDARSLVWQLRWIS